MRSKQLLPVLTGILILVLMAGSCTPSVQNPPTSITYVYDGKNYIPATGTVTPQPPAQVTVNTITQTTTPTQKPPTSTWYITPTPAYTVPATTTFATTPATTKATTTVPSTTTSSNTTTSTTNGIPITVGESKVVRVIDGDTIEVEIAGKPYKVRYIGIDTPELSSPFGPEATIKNSEFVSGKIVTLVKDTREVDDYGRLLRYVYIGGLFVNAELVKLGYARAVAYPPDTQYASDFSALENLAKSLQLGIWARRYVGSSNSTKYHLPSCTWAKKITPENERWFFSAADAKSQGYTPCGVCKPPEID